MTDKLLSEMKERELSEPSRHKQNLKEALESSARFKTDLKVSVRDKFQIPNKTEFKSCPSTSLNQHAVGI